jgi:glutaredoxin
MKISIEKAVELTDTCLCCNTIKEIEEKLKEYNKKNNTEYILEIEYVLYTTKNCGICNMVKHLINSKNLKISIKESDENDIQYLIKNKISNFPVLQIKAGEKVEFIFGKDAGEYIASNLQKFK